MADPLTIRQLLDGITSGNIRVPAFQRGFVWDPDRVAYFMDSIYKRYPFGSLLLWRSKHQLKIERELGPFELPSRDPEYPIDYILDGQQRATALFGVFQTELQPIKEEAWAKVYFDFKSPGDVQGSQFVVLSDHEVDRGRHFALNTLFSTVGYRRATQDLQETDVAKIDTLQELFKEARIPVQTLTTDDRTAVAIVFERVNRKGVELDVLQLLSAWTWSDEFDLTQRFGELQRELKPFGFDDLGADTTLLLRCCAAVIASDAAPDALIKLNGTEVRSRFEEVVNGIRGAIDFLRKNLHVFSIENLPFQTVLVPLAVFFSHPANQQLKTSAVQTSTILRWFWRTSFGKRYSSGVLRNLNTDIAEIRKLKEGKENNLAGAGLLLDPTVFASTSFRIDSVNTKAMILMLAGAGPKSFISGSAINLDGVLREYNRNEFHHMMPKEFVKKKYFGLSGHAAVYDVNCLANFCIISRVDNNRLRGDAPSEYAALMPKGAGLKSILDGALCPESLLSDDFNLFIWERATMLAARANSLMD